MQRGIPTVGAVRLLFRVETIEKEVVSEFWQIFYYRLTVAFDSLAVTVAALVAPVGTFTLDRKFLHLAVVRASLAGKLTDTVVHPD